MTYPKSSDPAAGIVPGHMCPEEFRTLGYRMVDWIADYMENVGKMPVRTGSPPGTVQDMLPGSPPETPEDWNSIFDDLNAVIKPNLTHWQHPGFFAYFPCNASGPGILGEIASAGLNVNAMLWATSPAAVELETRMLDWCLDLFGLPDHFRGNGVIQGTASEATLVALVAARHRDRQRTARAGITARPGRPVGDADNPWGSSDGQEYCVIASEQAHSSVIKAAMIAGIATGPDDRRHVKLIRTHPDGRMDLDDLRRVVGEICAGRQGPNGSGPRPIMVAATVGTTGTGAVDDIAGVRSVLDRVYLDHARIAWPGWLHVDAAWLGSAAVCPEHRDLLSGAEFADSLCINPHKWMLTNFDCDLLWVRNRGELTGALSVSPEYLQNAASQTGGVIDYRDWQIPLGRRFRALKLWFVLRHYGAEGLRAHIRRHIAWAEWFEQRVGEDGRFELVTPRSAAMVCFRLAAGDEQTKELLDRVNTTGEVLLSHTAAPGDGRFTLRFVPGSPLTGFDHVVRAWEVISSAASGRAC